MKVNSSLDTKEIVRTFVKRHDKDTFIKNDERNYCRTATKGRNGNEVTIHKFLKTTQINSMYFIQSLSNSTSKRPKKH